MLLAPDEDTDIVERVLRTTAYERIGKEAFQSGNHDWYINGSVQPREVAQTCRRHASCIRNRMLEKMQALPLHRAPI